jgi:SAM-dependent methyltransferase
MPETAWHLPTEKCRLIHSSPHPPDAAAVIGPLMKTPEARYFGKIAEAYDQRRSGAARWRLEDEAVSRMLEPFAGRVVLDLPVGTGRFVPIYKRLGCRLIGVDISSNMLSEARKKADEVGLADCQLKIGDATRLNPSEIAADVGVCIRLLNWLPAERAERAFTNIAAACREALVVGLRSIDLRAVEEKKRAALEQRLREAHTKPMKEGLPPNGPHSLASFEEWAEASGMTIVESQPIVELSGEIWIKMHLLKRAPRKPSLLRRLAGLHRPDS